MAIHLLNFLLCKLLVILLVELENGTHLGLLNGILSRLKVSLGIYLSVVALLSLFHSQPLFVWYSAMLTCVTKPETTMGVASWAIWCLKCCTCSEVLICYVFWAGNTKHAPVAFVFKGLKHSFPFTVDIQLLLQYCRTLKSTILSLALG